MKAALIFPLISSVVLASIAAREIDPQTMDPTRLSVLQILKTAMPTDANVPLPTGGTEPSWYAQLPADVKALLPGLYPVNVAAVSSAPAVVSEALPVSTPSVVASSTVASADAVSVSSSALAPASVFSPALGPSATSASGASHITVTKTLQYASSGVPVLSNGTSNGTLSAPTAPPSPSASGLFSAGISTAIKIETLAAVVWLALGTVFFLFA
ncbi:hypothetical protein ACN47E_002935 [Coniothyrium glycines]